MKVRDSIGYKVPDTRKVDNRSEENSKDVLDILLDDNNHDPIFLTDRKGENFVFEQIAVIPYEDDDGFVIYTILQPINGVIDVKDGEALVFCVAEDESGEIVLKIEKDDRIAAEIFNRYYDLLDEDLTAREKALLSAESTDIQN